MNSRALLVCALSAALCAAALADAPLAGSLPADMTVYCGWAGRSLVFDGSATGQLLQDPNIVDLLKAVEQVIDRNLPSPAAQTMFREAWALGGITWQHPIAVALRPLPPGVEAEFPLAAAILVDLGQDRAAFHRRLEAILQNLDKDTKIEEKTEAGMTYKTVAVEGQLVCFGYKGDMFFATLGEDLAKEILTLSPAKSLGASKRFLDDRRDVAGDDEQLSFFVDVSGMIHRYGMPSTAPAEPQTQPSEVRRTLDGLGVGKVTSVVGAVRIVDHGMYTKVRVLTPAPHRGLLLPLAGPELAAQDLAGVPDDADFFAAGKLSPQAMYDEIQRMAREAGGEKAEREFLRGVREAEEKLGVSITEDLLPALGDTWLLSSAPSQGGFLTGTVLSVTIKDPQKLSEAIAKMEASLAPPAAESQPATDETTSMPFSTEGGRPAIHKVAVGRLEVHYFTFGKSFVPVAPAWAISKDRLYLALWPQVLQTTFENAPGSKPLLQQAEFQKLYSHLGGKPSIVYYQNTSKIIRQFYPIYLIAGTVGVGAIPNRGQPDLPLLLPPALSTLERYSGPEVGGVSADEKGITFEAYGSQPSSMLAVPVYAGAMFPALYGVRSTAKVAVATNELHVLNQALLMYAADSSGQLPKTLEDPKLPPYVGAKDVSDASYQRMTAGVTLVSEGRSPNIDKLPDPGSVIILYRAPQGPGENVAAGYADGHVATLEAGSFWPQLQHSQEELQKVSAEAPARGPENF